MAVKLSSTVSRALSILEVIAAQQPIGVSAIAKALQADKSAVQRALATLSDAGWIRNSSEPTTRWELSNHLFAIARNAQSSHQLWQHARPYLEDLREQTQETTFLAVLDVNGLVVIDVAESRQILRTSPRIGEVLSLADSASGHAVLPYLNRTQQIERLGRAPNGPKQAEFSATRNRGFALSIGDNFQGATNLAAPFFDRHSQPLGSIVISGPSPRITTDCHDKIGALLVKSTNELSRLIQRHQIG